MPNINDYQNANKILKEIFNARGTESTLADRLDTIDTTVGNIHTHDNKDALDKITEVAGKVLFNEDELALVSAIPDISDKADRSEIPDISDLVTKAEIPDISGKADKSEVYTKTETDSEITTAISGLVNSAPSTLDTLNELATALGNDPNFATTIATQIGTKANSTDVYTKTESDSLLTTKVDKVTGKGLSSEDYSTVEKTKLSGIEVGSNNYIHPSTHLPSIIAQDSGNRFVTDTEKSTWNSKQSSLGFTPVANTVTVNGKALSTNVSITASDIGLGNVNNTTDANKPISTATQTALDLKAPLASPTFTGTVSGISKSMVDLGNVDNTSDLSKPISTATQTALDTKLSSSNYTATDVLSKILTVDGTGSNLDADTLDGQHGSYYATSTHNHSGVYEPVITSLAQSKITNLTTDLASKQNSLGYTPVNKSGDTMSGDLNFTTGKSILGAGVFASINRIYGFSSTYPLYGISYKQSSTDEIIFHTNGDNLNPTFSSSTLGVTAPKFISTVATGTAPLSVTSTTVVSNLNADLLDGKHASDLVTKVTDTSTLTVTGDYSGVAGLETILTDGSIGDLLYMTSTGMGLAKADADATLPCVAMRLATGTGSKAVLKQGYVKNTSWTFTAGQMLYVSPTTAGLITSTKPSTTGQRIQVVGYAVSATVIYFNPQYLFIEI